MRILLNIGYILILYFLPAFSIQATHKTALSKSLNSNFCMSNNSIPRNLLQNFTGLFRPTGYLANICRITPVSLRECLFRKFLIHTYYVAFLCSFSCLFFNFKSRMVSSNFSISISMFCIDSLCAATILALSSD